MAPARAINCACAIRDPVQSIGLSVRTGLHTGEVEMVDGDVHGIAVHIAARIMALAAPTRFSCRARFHRLYWDRESPSLTAAATS
jgi:class 3 adenylate cyclase